MPKVLTAAALATGGAVLGAVAAPAIRRRLAGPQFDARTVHRRAVEAVIWGVPVAAMAGVRKSLTAIGADYNQVVYFSKPLEARHEFITANNNTPYVVSVLDLRNGPIVLELPPATGKVALFGSAIDSFEVPLVDVGPAGDDQGKGGRYLFLPPGHSAAVPDSDFVVLSTTYFVHVALRPIVGIGGTLDDAVAYARTVKVYSHTQAASPQTRYVDAYPAPWKTLPAFDLTYFGDLAATIDVEPPQSKDAAMLGLLASLGIEKGRPFKPSRETAETLEKAAREAYAILQDRLTTGLESYWPDRRWGFPISPRRKDSRSSSAAGFWWTSGRPPSCSAHGSPRSWRRARISRPSATRQANCSRAGRPTGCTCRSTRRRAISGR